MGNDIRTTTAIVAMTIPVLFRRPQAERGLAHVGGYVGTDWRTDLEVGSPSSAVVDCDVRLLASDEANSNPPSVVMTPAAGTCTRTSDVLDASFAFVGTAALEIEATSGGELVTSSRTFDTTDEGTYGQFLPGVTREGVVMTGDHARVNQLSRDASDASGFRTNLGLVNRSSTATTVSVDLRGPGAAVPTAQLVQPSLIQPVDGAHRSPTPIDLRAAGTARSSADGK